MMARERRRKGKGGSDRIAENKACEIGKVCVCIGVVACILIQE